MQLQKNAVKTDHTRRIVIDALFAALFFVVSTIPPFTWKLGIIELSFFVTLPILASALLFSVGDAVLVALVGSFLEQLVSPYGLAPNTPLWMAPVILQGLFFGLCFALLSRKNLLWRGDGFPSKWVLLSVLIGEVLLTVANTGMLYLDGYLYHYPVKALNLLVFPKLANCLLRCSVTLVLTYALLPKLKNLINSRKHS